MLVLFFLGRDVEEAYGPKEFLRLYLVMVVFGNVVWNVVNKIAGTPADVTLYGASGAIAGVVVLYALNFPHRTLLLFFVIPIPAWLLGVLTGRPAICSGRAGESAGRTWRTPSTWPAPLSRLFTTSGGWNLTRLTPARIPWPSFRRKPRLRIHKPEQEPGSDLSAEVDRILEKIYREGEASLSAKERKTLETASREYQRKKMTKHE